MENNDSSQVTPQKTENSTANSGAAPTEEGVGFSIEKIYLKDASVEIPHAPQIFTERAAPDVNIELGHTSQSLNDNTFEVSLKLIVNAKVSEKTMFLVELTQSGIFQARNIPSENMPAVLAVICPNILFPYARESLSALVLRSGFQPILLNPVNFEALFQQQAADKANTEQTNPANGA